jgi:hypothetical protein
MTRTSVALTIASVGVVFSVVSGPSGAAQAGAKVASTHAVGGYHHRRYGFAMGGMLVKFAPMMMAMLANSQGGGGGFSSMFGGGGGFNTSGIMSMMGGMAGSGGTGGFGSMLGGSGGSGGLGGMTSMLGGGGMAGTGGAPATAVPQVSDAARQACTPDVFRLCSNYIPNVGRITACMKAKYPQLSAPCRDAMASAGAAPSQAANEGVAAPAGRPNVASYGGGPSGANFTSGQNFGGFQAGGIDIGQMMGMARSFGLGARSGW